MTALLDARSARVLLALSRAPEGLRLSDLASLNGMPLSSAQVVMRALERDGVIVREPAYRPRYRLAPSVPAGAIEQLARWRLPARDVEAVEGLADRTLRREDADQASSIESIGLPASVRDKRRRLLAILARRTRPGSGSDLARLMKGGRPMMAWWAAADTALRGIPHAAFGAVAAMQFMPARGTEDLDLVVRLVDLQAAEAALRTEGWQPTAALQLYGGLSGKAWTDPAGHLLDLIGLPGAWGAAAISTARFDPASRLRALTLPYSVLTKMISSRAKDVSDISRMLGSLSGEQLAPVMAVMKQHMTAADVEDLAQIIALGRLEASSEKAARKRVRGARRR